MHGHIFVGAPLDLIFISYVDVQGVEVNVPYKACLALAHPHS